MADKAYIVANKEQELDILKKFKGDGIYWNAGEYATDFIPSEKVSFEIFPYALVKNKSVYWSSIDKLKDTEIVYDGLKDEKKYKVTQEFMNELIEWRDADWRTTFIVQDLAWLPIIVSSWCFENENSIENNNRLIAIIQWLNGEEVFEVEAPHKFVVRSDDTDENDDYWYVNLYKGLSHVVYNFGSATKFDTREESQEWANSHQVVVKIDAEGNEVE